MAAPGVPTSITSSAGGNSVTLSWAVPASDGGSPILYYTARAISIDTGQTYTIVTAALTVTFTGLDATGGASYSVGVRAHNADGFSEFEGPGGLSATVTPSEAGNAVTPSPATYVGVTGVTNYGSQASSSPSWRPVAADNVHSLELNGRLPVNDEVFCTGKYLFLSRNQRWYLMTRLESGENVWTELVFPVFYSYQPFAPKHMCELNGNVYFIGELGTVWRLESGESESQLWANRRGTITYNDPQYPATLSTSVADYSADNLPPGWVRTETPTLTVSTATLAHEDMVTKSFWHRVALRVRRPFANVESQSSFVSRLVKIITSDKPAVTLDMESYWLNETPVQYETSKNQDVYERTEVVVPAHGPSLEFSATAEFQGDVIVEGMAVYKHGKNPRRK